MTLFLILSCSAAILILGGRFYAPIIGRVLGERPDRMAPSVAINDGRDYVPTQTPVVFAHHYASIAGAGPIIGPVLAVLYGWGPALLWILLGGVFLGAVHDYVATHVAMREGGKNLTVVARRYIGGGAFVMLLILLIALLGLVCAAFLDLSATALTSQVALSELDLAPGNSLFREADTANARTGEIEPHAIIGGIASTSVIFITVCSPLLGFLYLKRKLSVWICSLLALGICLASILIGVRFPIPVTPFTWKLLISAYVLISAGLPVWLFLQSRDFINVHMLYVGMAFLVASLIGAAIRGGGELASSVSAMPMNNWSDGVEQWGPGWPVLFVLIACGAVSGFHSLCAGGTTCKQLMNEPAARKVGYHGMLLECFLAVCVVCCVIVGLSLAGYKAYQYPAAGKGNAVLTFAMAVGKTAHIGLGIPVAYGVLGAMLLLEGFLVTTLDTAIRLTRYMIEEGWGAFFGKYDVFADAAAVSASATGSAGASNAALPTPSAPSASPLVPDERAPTELVGTGGLTSEPPKLIEPMVGGAVIRTRGAFHWFLKLLQHYWINSGLAVGMMLLLGLGGGYKALWAIFGSANQLLASLTFLVVTCWLVQKGRPVWYTLLPAVFMLATSVTMLVRLLAQYMPDWRNSWPLVFTALLALGMTGGIIVLALMRYLRHSGGAMARAGQPT